MSKFVAGAVTATLVATAVVPSAAESFTDIGKLEAGVQAEVVKAVELGFFNDAPLFNPGNQITRGQAALTLARYLSGEEGVKAYALVHQLESKVTPFDDIPVQYKDGNAYQQELFYSSLILKQAGAFTQAQLKPGNQLTRAQMAKIIVQTFNLQKKEGFVSPITDTQKLSPETIGYIETISSYGITNVKKFRPAETVTRGQMASFLVRSYKTVHEADKVIASVEEIKDISIFAGEKIELPKTVTVTYEDASKVDVAVKWNTTGIDFTKAGSYDLKGEIANTKLTAAIKVEVKVVQPEVPKVKYPEPVLARAINNTTVEVTFVENIFDIKALDFKIKDLEVKKTVVKQTDSKTVVLTTAAQDANKDYTVTVSGNKFVAFKGVSAVHKLTVEALGSEYAATYLNPTETGGRDYKLTYTDVDGKAVVGNTTVKVAIDPTGLKGIFRVLDSKGNLIPVIKNTDGKNYYNVLIEENGQATFTVTSDQANDSVSPIVFIDNGKPSGVNILDEDDLQANAAITYFSDSVTYSAKLEVLGADGKAAKLVFADNTQFVDFVYKLVDQNGKPRRPANKIDVTFNVAVNPGKLRIVKSENDLIVEPGRMEVVGAQIPIDGTQCFIRVHAMEASTAHVTAKVSTESAEFQSIESTVQTAEFLSTSTLFDGITYAGAIVISVDKDANEVTLRIYGKEHTVEYANGRLYISGDLKSIEDFEAALSYGDTVTYVPGTPSFFDITEDITDTTAPLLTNITYVPGSKASAKIISGTDELLFTADEFDSALNGLIIQLVKSNPPDYLTSAAYQKSYSGKQWLTVRLGSNANWADVISAVDRFTKSWKTKIKATTEAAEPNSILAVAGEVVLGELVSGESAKIKVQFDEAIANTEEVEKNISVTNNTIVRSLGTSPQFDWSDDKQKLTIILDTDHTTQRGDRFTVFDLKDAAGNTSASISGTLQSPVP